MYFQYRAARAAHVTQYRATRAAHVTQYRAARAAHDTQYYFYIMFILIFGKVLEKSL